MFGGRVSGVELMHPPVILLYYSRHEKNVNVASIRRVNERYTAVLTRCGIYRKKLGPEKPFRRTIPHDGTICIGIY